MDPEPEYLIIKNPELMTNDHGIELANNIIKLLHSETHSEWLKFFILVLETI